MSDDATDKARSWLGTLLPALVVFVGLVIWGAKQGSQIDNLNKGLETHEKTTVTESDRLRSDMGIRLASLELALQRAETRVYALEASTKVLEERVAGSSQTMRGFENALSGARQAQREEHQELARKVDETRTDLRRIYDYKPPGDRRTGE